MTFEAGIRSSMAGPPLARILRPNEPWGGLSRMFSRLYSGVSPLVPEVGGRRRRMASIGQPSGSLLLKGHKLKSEARGSAEETQLKPYSTIRPRINGESTEIQPRFDPEPLGNLWGSPSPQGIHPWGSPPAPGGSPGGSLQRIGGDQIRGGVSVAGF
jgi:hypothetical protein